MSDATTTADGFRVGRRVMAKGFGVGEIVGGSSHTWVVRRPSGCEIAVSEYDLELLPEPDAPATPEPPADDKPSYYAKLRDAGCEPWDVMAAAYPADWCLAYQVLTALVYLMRCKLKHPMPADDIRKAYAHLEEAMAIMDGKPTN